ncbi:MAG: glycosyltransferase [Treponema sp.]|jgi:glycosyltransferase involved in cell wall biosynthesis|nr:glycosyltransferase [Treponema sp.]
MKIAIFTDAYWPRVNGVTVSVDTYARALARKGHHVLIVCNEYPHDGPGALPRGTAEDETPPLLTLLRVPSGVVFFSHEDRAAHFRERGRVEAALDSFGAEVLHVNTEFVIAGFGFKYGKKRRLPVIFTFHTMWEEYIANYFPYLPKAFLIRFARWYMRRIFMRADILVAPSAQALHMLKSYRTGKVLEHLPTGVDPALFRHGAEELARFRTDLEARFPALAGKRILLFAGRVAREKNISLIIGLMREWRGRHGDLILMIAGNGPYLEYHRAEAKKLGVEAACVFTGYLSREDLSYCYGISKVFLLPSKTETQGLVTIESMLSGVPVVAIGAMGTLEVMGGDNGGFMVPDERAVFRDRVLDLIEDEELYRRKSEEARRHAQAWTVDGLSEKLAGIYRSALLRNRR